MQDSVYNAALEHLANIIFDPNLNDAKQTQFNNQRLLDVLDCVRYRPYFLPVQIPMPLEVATLPKTGSTETVDDERVIITGAITDGEDKKINFKRNRQNAPLFVSTEGTSNAQISIEAIAGKSSEAKGIAKIEDFFPFMMVKDESLAIFVYKPVATENSDLVSIVFTGCSILSQSEVDALLTPALLDTIKEQIERRVTPETRYATCDVEFKGTGDLKKATARTPKSDEPLLVTGIRSTFKNAKVNLSFRKNGNFAKDLFPLWALASEAGNTAENFRPLKKKLLIPPLKQLFFELENTIDGETYASDGQIELKLQTV